MGHDMLKTKNAVGANVIELTPNLDLTQAGPLADTLSQIRGTAVEIHAHHVERLGALCAQVIMSARQTWAKDDIEFSIQTPSSAFEQGFEAIGLDAMEMTVNTAA